MTAAGHQAPTHGEPHKLTVQVFGGDLEQLASPEGIGTEG
jgi:hypothetical protein